MMPVIKAHNIEAIVWRDSARANTKERTATITAYVAARLANRIEAIRERSDVTLEELAARVGSSKSHMSRVLSGNYTGMSLGTLVRIAYALGYEPEIKLRSLDTGQARRGALVAR